MVKKNNFFFITLLFLLVSPSVFSLFHQGFFLTDDGNWMVIRFSAFYQTLRNGQFPPRFLLNLNHGYGYPVADFLYPLFMYLGVPVHILGFGFVTTIKIILGGSVLLSGLFCFFWLRKLFGAISSLIGGIFYVLFPYHLFDVYKRGSVGEVLALAIVPYIFWQVETGNWIFTAFGIALLLLAHNSLALLFLPVIFMYIVIKKIFSPVHIIYILLFSLSLSAFFWIPALYDKQFTVFDKINVSDFSKYFISLINTELAGSALFLVLAISAYNLFRKPAKNTIFFFLVAVISFFFTLSISSFFWKILFLGQFVQFPFRFLSVVMFCGAFLLANIIEKIKEKFKIIVAAFFLLIIYLSSLKFLFPVNYQTYPDDFYSTNQDTTTVRNEYMPKWVQTIPLSYPQKKVEVIQGTAQIENLATRGNVIVFTPNVQSKSTAQIQTVYFPGWKVYVDKKETRVTYNNPKGLITFLLEQGRHEVKVKFTETSIRNISDIITICGILSLLSLGIAKKRNKR